MEIKLNQRMLVIILLLMAPMSGIGIDIYTPSLPAITHEFAVRASLVKLTLSTYLLGLGAGQFIFGTLSDSLGRRRLLLVGMIAYVVVTVAITMSTSIGMLLVLRLFQGLVTGVPAAVYRSIILDSFTGHAMKKITAAGSAVWALGPIVAPFIGGYLQHYFAWQASFYFLAIYGACLLFLMYWYLPETVKVFTPLTFTALTRNVLTVMQSRLFVVIAISISLAYCVIVAFNIVAPYMIQVVLGYTSVFYGHIALLVGAAYFLGCVSNNFLIRKFLLKDVMLMGLLIVNIMGLVGVLIAVLNGMTWATIVFPMVVIYFGYGWVQPNGFIKALSLFPHLAGAASSLWGALILVITSVISSLAVLLETHTAVPFSLAVFGLGFVYLSIYLLLVRPHFLEE